MCERSHVFQRITGKRGLIAALAAQLLLTAVAEPASAVTRRPRQLGSSGLGFQLLGGLRGYFQNAFFSTSATNSGSTGILGSLYPQAHLTGRYNFGGWGISPSFGITPIPASDSDGGISKTTGTLGLNLEIQRGSVDLKTGPGMTVIRYSGSGGVVELGNGNSTSPYPLPDGSATVTAAFWGVGAGWWLGQGAEWRMDTDLHVNAAFSDRRTVSLLVSFSYLLM